MFLSASKFYQQSHGGAYISSGTSNPNLNGAAYFNNGSGFDLLFALPWDGYGLSPDLAVDLEFNTVPEPSTLVLVGAGALSAATTLRLKPR